MNFYRTKPKEKELLLKVRQSRNDFFKPTFLPKNERTNSTLLLVDLFSFIFWKKVKTPKRHFEINITVSSDKILLKCNNVQWRKCTFKTTMITTRNTTMELGFGNNCFVGHVVHIFLAFLYWI